MYTDVQMDMQILQSNGQPARRTDRQIDRQKLERQTDGQMNSQIDKLSD